MLVKCFLGKFNEQIWEQEIYPPGDTHGDNNFSYMGYVKRLIGPLNPKIFFLEMYTINQFCSPRPLNHVRDTRWAM